MLVIAYLCLPIEQADFQGSKETLKKQMPS